MGISSDGPPDSRTVGRNCNTPAPTDSPTVRPTDVRTSRRFMTWESLLSRAPAPVAPRARPRSPGRPGSDAPGARSPPPASVGGAAAAPTRARRPARPRSSPAFPPLPRTGRAPSAAAGYPTGPRSAPPAGGFRLGLPPLHPPFPDVQPQAARTARRGRYPLGRRAAARSPTRESDRPEAPAAGRARRSDRWRRADRRRTDPRPGTTAALLSGRPSTAPPSRAAPAHRRSSPPGAPSRRGRVRRVGGRLRDGGREHAPGALGLAPAQQQLGRKAVHERLGVGRQDRAQDPLPLLRRRFGERTRGARELRRCLAQRGRPFARRPFPLAHALQQFAQLDAEHPGPPQRASPEQE